VNLIGGRGSDRMSGGSGADTHRFLAAQSRAGEVDVVTDFAVGQDHLAFQGLSVATLTQLDVNGDAVLDTSLRLTDGAVVQLLGVSGVGDWHALL
jgi:Ca2+-binding RTX toxin-like protein